MLATSGVTFKLSIECTTRRGGKITCVATSYRNGECRSLKVTVFGPYQVLPDVIVSITPHAVVVKHYYNGWLRDYKKPTV